MQYAGTTERSRGPVGAPKHLEDVAQLCSGDNVVDVAHARLSDAEPLAVGLACNRATTRRAGRMKRGRGARVAAGT